MSLLNISNIPYERSYAIGACFLCQQCLFCDNKLTFITCECDLNKKPTLKNTGKKKESFILESIIQKQDIQYIIHHNLKN